MILNKIYVNEMWGTEKERYKIDKNKAIQTFNDLVREEMRQVYETIDKEDFSEEVASFRSWEDGYELIFRKCPLIVYKKDNKMIARIYSWGQPDYEYREADIESKEVVLEQIEVEE